jgi:hypothetical protein
MNIIDFRHFDSSTEEKRFTDLPLDSSITQGASFLVSMFTNSVLPVLTFLRKLESKSAFLA